MYSLVVSGSEASSIVLITSTNGTCATTALNRSGRMLATAPISRPPALPPWITSRSGERVPVLDEVLGAVDEVGERVHLQHHPPLLAPLLAELAAAADVGQRVDHAAVEQAQAARREGRRHRHAVGAVGVEQHRRRAVERHALPVDERDRHLRAVARRRPHPLRFVLRRVVAAEHFLPLEQRPLLRVEVVVVDRWPASPSTGS